MRTIADYDHADEWRREARAERMGYVPMPEDGEDRHSCGDCPGWERGTDEPTCAFSDGSACEHCTVDGTLTMAEALAKWEGEQ